MVTINASFFHIQQPIKHLKCFLIALCVLNNNQRNLKKLQTNDKRFYTKLDDRNPLMEYLAGTLYLSTKATFAKSNIKEDFVYM